MAQYGSDNGNYKGYMHRKCKQCSGPINGSSATRKFCSRDCQIASYRSEANFKTCPWCNKDFYHRSNTHCSAECARASRASKAKNPGVKQARKLGLTPGTVGRPPATKQPRVCGVCSKGFLVRPSEADRKYCCKSCYGVAVGERQRGELHHNYKDGKTKDRTSERQALRRHVGYAAWRDAVFARDGYACRACTASGVQLEAHHHVPWATDAKLRLKVSNGITLCRECHRLWHAYDRKGLFSGKESALQSKVIAALVEYGFYVFNVPGTPMGTNGVPDLIVCYEGVFGGLECKVFPNYLTELQKAQGKRIVEAGGIFYVVQSEDDIGRVIELFETRRRIKSAWSETFSEGERDDSRRMAPR